MNKPDIKIPDWINKAEVAARSYPHLSRNSAKARLSNQLAGREPLPVDDKVAIYRTLATFATELATSLPAASQK